MNNKGIKTHAQNCEADLSSSEPVMQKCLTENIMISATRLDQFKAQTACNYKIGLPER